MPYADPETQKEAKRRWYAKKYKEREFQRAEAERKAKWLQTEQGKEVNRENSKRNMALMRTRKRRVQSIARATQKARALTLKSPSLAGCRRS